MRKLLKQANNDIFGILEFDNRVIYEPIVQAPMQVFLSYRQMGILIQKML